MSGDVQFLQQHAALIAKLLNHTFDACLICQFVDNELQTVYANQTFYTLTGQAKEEVIGNRPQITAHKPSADSIRQSIEERYRNNQTFEKDYSGISRTGNPFWAILKSFPIEETGTRFCVILLKDISIRKKSENELTKVIKELEDAKVVKDKFLANMSHEMRTPLNGILGMAQLLETRELDGEQKEFVAEIKQSADNLLAIINDILEFNFLKSSGFRLESRRFNLRKKLESVVDTVKERAERKGLEIESIVSEKMPEMFVGDTVRLSQILLNVIGNSIKFTRDGKVTIFARALEEENGRVPVEIKVKDTGIGIPDSMIDDVFDSFNQASKSTSYKYGGTGIGLSIVKQLIGHMDGKISLKSEVGKGTVVHIILPFEVLNKPAHKTSIETHSTVKEREKYPGHHVLVVDDYPLNRRIVKGMLKRIGVTVDEAQDGREAVEMNRDKNYSAIFMDVHMPGMGGLEASRVIREEESSGNRTPIIAITASVLDRDIEACKNAGMDGFIAKPFTLNELTENFRKFIIDKNGQTAPPVEESDEYSAEYILQNLREMTGDDREMQIEMLELFLEQTPELLNKITSHFEEGSYDLVKSSAHTLKPTFTYVGMNEGTKLAETIEDKAAQKNVPVQELKGLISEFQKVSEEAISSVRKLRDSLLK